MELALCREGPRKSSLSTASTHEIYRPDPLDAFPEPKIQTPTSRPLALFSVSIFPLTSLFPTAIALRSPLAQHASHRSRAPSAVVRSCV